MPRKVNEWIGKTDDTMPPPSVRLRIFEQHGGRCRLTGKIGKNGLKPEVTYTTLDGQFIELQDQPNGGH